MKKRGQAAMEFLMTYGWALLVVLVAIGALAFFGVLDPGKFLPASCTLFPGLGCNDFKIDGSTDTVTLIVQNGLGSDMSLTSFTASGDCTSTDVNGDLSTCTMSGGACDSNSIPDGAECQVDCTCQETLTSGGKAKVDITIVYTTGTLPHTKTGQLTAPIE